MAEKKVDSYKFLHGVEKRMLRCWTNLPRETQIPWTVLARPLSQCTVSLVTSAGSALKTDDPFNPEIEVEARFPQPAAAARARISSFSLTSWSAGIQELTTLAA